MVNVQNGISPWRFVPIRLVRWTGGRGEVSGKTKEGACWTRWYRRSARGKGPSEYRKLGEGRHQGEQNLEASRREGRDVREPGGEAKKRRRGKRTEQAWIGG